jgi:metallo-beta-lactamase family protein
MKISFLGAADGVTGSRHLVESAGQTHPARLRPVPGLQGAARAQLGAAPAAMLRLHRRRGAQPCPPGPQRLAARLVKHGYRGPIYASAATCDLAEVLLLDSAHLQEEDARRANRYGYRATPRRCRCTPRPTPARDRQAHAAAHARELRMGGQVRRHADTGGPPAGRLRVTLAAAARRWCSRGDLGRSGDLLMPPRSTSTAPTCCSSSRPTATVLHPAEDVADAAGRHRARHHGAAARCCCRPSRWAARRPCCWCCSG